MSTLTWLHLSDWHWREADGYDANIVMGKLLDDLANRARFAPEIAKINLIFVTGDIAFAGCSGDYALARRFLKRLRQATRVRKDQLFMVPGNHDVNRALITTKARSLVAGLNDSRAATQLLTDEENRAALIKRLHGYQRFVNDELGYAFDSSRYFYVKQRHCADKRITILGLNSVWASGSDADRLHLFLGEPQVREASHKAEHADIRIALMHHPFEYLHDDDRAVCEELLLRECHFVLHGHLHRSGVRQLRAPGIKAMIIGAGACFETRESQNAYNLVHLDFTAGRGTIYLRMYSNRGGGFWTEDNLTYQGIHGKYEFDLPEEWRARNVEERLTVRSPGVAAPPRPAVAPQSALGQWWRKRGYAADPFRWLDAADVEEKALPSLLRELQVDPAMPIKNRGVGESHTFDQIAAFDTSAPVLIYAPTGGGKTFYRRWVAHEILQMGEYALQIRNPSAKLAQPRNITVPDLAQCVLKSIQAAYGVTATPIGRDVEHILDACDIALANLNPCPQRVYVFLDNLQQFFYARAEYAERNGAALDAIAELCTVAAKRGGGIMALRLFLPLSVRPLLQARLDPSCPIRECVIQWSPEYWRAIAERRLASAWGKPKNGHLSFLLAEDSELEIDKWFKSQPQITPRCVIKILGELVNWACLSVQSKKRIGVDVWKEFSGGLAVSPCTDKEYPIEIPTSRGEPHLPVTNPNVRIFISYSSKDEPVVEKLAGKLQMAGFRCWRDKKDILLGEPLLDRVREGITEESDYTLLILSKDSMMSEWCKLELRMAYAKELQQRRVVVLPIRIDLTAIPAEINVKRYYQLDPTTESSFDALLEEIRSIVRKQTNAQGVDHTTN